MVMDLFKSGIMIHMAFAFWTYSNPYFFPRSDFYISATNAGSDNIFNYSGYKWVLQDPY